MVPTDRKGTDHADLHLGVVSSPSSTTPSRWQPPHAEQKHIALGNKSQAAEAPAVAFSVVSTAHQAAPEHVLAPVLHTEPVFQDSEGVHPK